MKVGRDFDGYGKFEVMLRVIAYFVCQSHLGHVHTDYYTVNKNMHMGKQVKLL